MTLQTDTSIAPTPVLAKAPAARETFEREFRHELAQSSEGATPAACLRAAAAACRYELEERWARTQAEDRVALAGRRVHYLSMEFLMGRALGNALMALGLHEPLRAQLGAGAPELGDVLEREPDAALGNGGLGRLAACFLDSFATLGLPSFGYGLRYEFGMFRQRIAHGRQVEEPDDWMRHGNPWEVARPEVRYAVGFGGRVTSDGGARQWVPAEIVVAQAFDFIVPGHGTERVSTLRQWHARSRNPIDFTAFCRGQYANAAADKLAAESLDWVLYPDDSTPAGRELRLKQEFVLVSASLQDMLARHLREQGSLDNFAARNAIHLNDTHPGLVPAELMRLLMDQHAMSWDEAWAITHGCVSYTNHTLMPEALEKWPVAMLEALLPRHLEIVYEINFRLLQDVRRRYPGDEGMIGRVSLVDETGGRSVRMASLAIAASTKVNGVSELHSELMRKTIFSDFAQLYPERFINVTNGVTPRRWLQQANPGLASVLDEHIGTEWRSDLTHVAALAPLATDIALGQAFRAVKRANKVRLAERITRETGISVDADSLFDVQVKRIHEYKRQLLNVLHIVWRYQAMLANPQAKWTARTIIFGGKAASAYQTAKTIIRLVHDVARVVNSDARLNNRLKVVFLPNYGVSLAELIMPAADLSEQISTAGTEASGTGNMKFALNGALTIGTWDGANIEMAQAMGVDNMFVFGLRADAVDRMKSLGYDPSLYVEENAQLRAVVEAIASGQFSDGDPNRYRGLMDALRLRDAYMLMADFGHYVAAQTRVDTLYREPEAWTARALRNIAGMGTFSTDRTIHEYVRKVWSDARC
ncbi:MAG TPA: glycogen/starch/alpha-glucan phosphorylase [Burkholderiaceae bacterium]|jgi:starch phosphorylase|nr:glycogen/starch/alpha-glucan phosphorylase [Burkholderiaceae bacterium]